MITTEVAVVGFGPVGAALSGLLGLHGIHVTVIDRDLDVFPLPRAAHIDHQGLRMLQELGCLDVLLPTMIRNPGLDFVTPDGRLLFQIPGNQASVSGLPASMYFHQPGFDKVIRGIAERLPTVDIRLGTEMIGLDAAADHAIIHARTIGGQALDIRAEWVIGCDGSWSPVREMSRMALEDLQFDEAWIVVDLILLRDIPTLPDRALNICDPARPITVIPIPNGRFRFEMMLLPGEDAVAMQQPASVLALLSDWVPADAVQVERSAVYTFHGLLAYPWRRGRVLVAGDAAHQMPPFLGQGMNSGLRDAGNLAWKLANVIRRQAPESLLDTYESERKPHVRKIVEAAVSYGRITCITDPVVAARLHNEWLSNPAPPREKLRFKLPPLSPGPLILEGGGGLFPQPVERGPGGMLDDLIGHGFFVLARDEGALGKSRRFWAETAGGLVMTYAELPPAYKMVRNWLDGRKADAVVVRPDHYVLAVTGNLDEVTAEVATILSAGAATASTRPA
jgi:3-(3-hydroxy-phenyl)propionate hydroxylase